MFSGIPSVWKLPVSGKYSRLIALYRTENLHSGGLPGLYDAPLLLWPWGAVPASISFPALLVNRIVLARSMNHSNVSTSGS
jgi:hypothetical protein